MQVSKEIFFAIGANSSISKEQLQTFWVAIEDSSQSLSSKSNRLIKYLLSFGSLATIIASIYILSKNASLFGSLELSFIATLYALGSVLMGRFLWNNNQRKTSAGLFLTMAVGMTAYALFNLGNYWGFSGAGQRVFAEIGAIMTALLALRYFAIPFLIASLFYSIWSLTMDVGILLFGDILLKGCFWITLALGITMGGVARLIECRGNKDYSYWGYFFGTLLFWIGLTGLMWGVTETTLLTYPIANTILIYLGVSLRKKVFLVFGTAGVIGYLGHLSHVTFANSSLFYLSLSLIGLLTIYIGIFYQKYSKSVERLG